MGINYIFLVACLKLCLASSDLDKSNPNSTESDVHIAEFKNHIHEHYGKVLGSLPVSSREEGMHFVKMIFEAFGEDNEMSSDSLKKLFMDIGISLAGESSNDGHHTSNTHVSKGLDSDDHKHGFDETQINGQNHHKGRHRRAPYKPHLHKNHMRCLSIHDMFHVYHFQNEDRLTTEQFLHLCPALIYQLNNRKCKVSGRSDHMEDDASAPETVGFSGVPAAVWGYSTLAVVIISLVGLLGVAVIPIMQKVFYNHLLQFLVALAVGALTGDAMLHLLPHAIAGESLHHDDHGHHENHKSAMFKGLCGLGGVFFFFLTERLVTIFASFKKKRRQKRRMTKSHRDESACKGDGYTAQKLATYTKCKCQSGEERIVTDCTHLKVFHTSDSSCPETKHSHSNPHIAEKEGFLSPSHSKSGHLHSHDGILTNTVTSVAWMVILGDGIHNLSDGLAIGAAFADNITGGFSTAIAVFCHELPHEIGDFAVLLRAGMSVKQAIVYNILSSVMCFIGMLIGVAIGNIDEATQWIFAAIAGIFIYIAMVDMLPEMTSGTQEERYLLCHLFLHCLGMTTGAGIMLIIAFFEEDLLTVLGN